MNFYPFHIGDYISRTSHLSDLEDLAYRRMIDLYYQNEKGFLNAEWVARRIRSTPEIVAGLLEEFFVYNNEFGFWSNTRADEELAKYHAMQEGGRKGAALRWNKGSDSPPKQPLMQTKNQEPLTKNHIKTITPKGVSDSIFKDYMEVRKAKKAKWTETALKGLLREAKKADISLEDAIRTCVERNWVGFKAEWLENDKQSTTNDKQWMFSNAGIEGKAKELGLNSMGLTYQQLKEKCQFVMARKMVA